MRAIFLLALSISSTQASPLGCPFISRGPSSNDANRAQQTVPRAAYLDQIDSISSKLNEHLSSDTGLSTAPCDAFTLKELKELQQALHCQLSADLNGIYKSKADARALRFPDLLDFERHWEAQEAEIEQDPSAYPVLRAARCAETVQWYVHHLHEDAKEA